MKEIPIFATPEEAMKSLEDPSAQAMTMINTTSNIKTANTAAEELEVMKALVEFSRTDTNLLYTYWNRLQTLAIQIVDYDYEHPHDLSMYFYAKILIQRAREIGQTAPIQQVIQYVESIPNTFWSKCYVHEIKVGRLDH